MGDAGYIYLQTMQAIPPPWLGITFSFFHFFIYTRQALGNYLGAKGGLLFLSRLINDG